MIGRLTCAVLGLVGLLGAANAAAAAEKSPWNGIWIGTFDNFSKISVTIADDKVTAYSYRGANIDVAYSRPGANTFTFGDGANYSMRLKRTADSAAEATYQGRHGFVVAKMMKQ